jgi:putative endonuclease
MQNNSQKLGKEGEDIAVKHLSAQGYKILERNWRYQKYEIDIIALKDQVVVFVEVKMRSTDEYGEPEVFVNRKKQSFLVAAAHQYIIHKDVDLEARFDIIAVGAINNSIAVKHLEGAFYPTAK